MKGKWDLFFSFHAYTEPAGLGRERTWGRSELKCVTGKMASLDVPARWVEGFGPSASALLFVEQGGIVILYFHVFFQNAFLNYYYFKKTTISVTLTSFRKIYMCWIKPNAWYFRAPRDASESGWGVILRTVLRLGKTFTANPSVQAIQIT